MTEYPITNVKSRVLSRYLKRHVGRFFQQCDKSSTFKKLYRQDIMCMTTKHKAHVQIMVRKLEAIETQDRDADETTRTEKQLKNCYCIVVIIS